MTQSHPYTSLPKRAFWKSAISQRHFSEIESISEKFELNATDMVATAGSCFAQHIGNALRRNGLNYMDLEPAPAGLSAQEAPQHGFGIYSCRYGNIYTARQLLQLIQECYGQRKPRELTWQLGDRFIDALRPSVDPVGHDSAEIIVGLRNLHLQRVREMFEQLDILVFTLGLTEAWVDTADGTAYPTCPGTVGGCFDASKYHFVNFSYPEILQDLKDFREALKLVNNSARILLTVSPVPLSATASKQHVLSATIYSKSTLRAVAGDLASSYSDVIYFPSYEIISSHPFHGTFFNPGLRTVNEMGVNLVMKHFFSAISFGTGEVKEDHAKLAIVCDEEKLETFQRIT